MLFKERIIIIVYGEEVCVSNYVPKLDFIWTDFTKKKKKHKLENEFSIIIKLVWQARQVNLMIK